MPNYTTKNVEATTRLQKLIARALCPSATDGESETSARLAIREARRLRMDIAAFGEALGATRQVEERIVYRDRTDPLADAKLFRFPFGKYRGQTVGEVWPVDPRYIRWVVWNVIDADAALIDACCIVAGIDPAEVRP